MLSIDSTVVCHHALLMTATTKRAAARAARKLQAELTAMRAAGMAYGTPAVEQVREALEAALATARGEQ